MILILVIITHKGFLLLQSNKKPLEDTGHAWNFFLIYPNL